MNECVFSEDRRYRYYLKHRWDDLMPEKAMMWIGLNPSTADENKLDPTLRRIKGFCTAHGYNCFYMLNLFAFRATKPEEMMKAKDPISSINDSWLMEIAKKNMPIVCAWGRLGMFKHRDESVYRLLSKTMNKELLYLKKTSNGQPKHPLYISRDVILKPYKK